MLLFAASCGGADESINLLDRKFGIRGSSACDELNQLFAITLQDHLTKSSSDAYEIYRGALKDAPKAVEIYKPRYPKSVEYNRALAAISEDVLNDTTEANWISRLKGCSDLARLQDFVNQNVANEVVDISDRMALFHGFLRGMARHLDNMSHYDQSENESLHARSTSAVYDFGFSLDLDREYKLNKTSGGVRVFAALSSSPLNAGDEIVEFKDESEEVFKPIERVLQEPSAGPDWLKTYFYENSYSKIRLKVSRADKPGVLEEVELAGDEATMPPQVDARIIDHTAYIRMQDFNNLNIAREFSRALDRVFREDRKVNGIILDLRYNRGGYRDQMTDIANQFLPAGAVGTIEERGRTRTLRFKEAGRYLSQPMVILINALSISASEMLTQILSESGRAVVVGTASFGKFIGQTSYSLGVLGGEFWLTSQRFYGPSGQSLQAIGNLPHIRVVDPEFESLKAKCLESDECSAFSIRDAGLKNFIPETSETQSVFSVAVSDEAKIQLSPELKRTLISDDLKASKDPQLAVALKILESTR